MTTKEKAKAYDEIIARAKKYLEDCPDRVDARGCIEHLIPELKESKDVRIELLNYLYDVHDDDEERARWITWLEKQGEYAKFRDSIQVGDKVTRNQDGVLVNLSQLKRVAKRDEKQGEQKPTDKIEPKFKVGDKVIPKNHQEESLIITKVTDTEYYSGDLLICKIDEQDKWELAEQDPCKDCTSPNCYFCEHNEHEEIKRMEEAMQNSEWSKEDEICFQNTLCAVKEQYPEGYKELVPWLKSLKERVQPQPNQEWSEEDEITRDALTNLVEMYYGGCIDKSEKNRLLSWLKSLRPKNTWKPSEEQMEALRIAKVYPSSERREILETLYTDLEQLKAL